MTACARTCNPGQSAMRMNLPPGWVTCVSKQYSTTYYFDTQTGESTWIQPTEPVDRGQKRGYDRAESGAGKRFRNELGSEDNVKVAIVVPFRDLDAAQQRQKHLERFVPYMVEFMSRQRVDFHVYIVEQPDDQRKFNRGKLLNIGFDLAKKDGCTAFVFHDVDLLPSQGLGRWYSYIPKCPVHIARVWGRYSGSPSYFGGVVAFSREQFELINGFPNTFWGWGGEDDNMYRRLQEVGLQTTAPDEREGTFTDLEDMSIQDKLSLLKQNASWKCVIKKEVAKQWGDWQENGLTGRLGLTYSELGRQSLHDHCTKVTVEVQLNNHWTDSAESWDDVEHLRQKGVLPQK